MDGREPLVLMPIKKLVVVIRVHLEILETLELMETQVQKVPVENRETRVQ